MKNDIYPLVVVLDRYNGTYSGGKWTAWNLSYVPSKIDADDVECADFFAKPNLVFGRGETPEEAIKDLKMILDCGISDPDEEDEEDKEMEPTSKQVINSCNFVNIYQDPDGESTRLTLKNDDDTFEIEINGHETYEAFRRLIFNDHNCSEVRKKNQELCDEIKEKNRKINDLYHELHELKIVNRRLEWKSKDISDDNALLLETNKDLKQENDDRTISAIAAKERNRMLEIENEKLNKEIADARSTIAVFEEKFEKIKKANMLDKNAADYWSKEHDILLERFAKLQVENEKLKELRTPTIENFADKEPSSRRDILKSAEKCVCGQREQDYGTPESNFQLIADLWNNYLGITDYVLEMEERFMDLNDKGIKVDVDLPKPKIIFPEDVAMMMALLKIARIKNGGGSGDSFVDLAGYAACGGEIWADKKSQKDQN